MARRRAGALTITLRLLVVAGLVVDAVVHLHLAGGYQQAQPGGIGEGTIFRIESVVALLTAVLVLVRPGRPTYALTALVGLSALAAVLVSRYANVPAIGPIPTMYEPIWFFQKTLSAVAEGVAGVGAVLLLAGTDSSRRRH